MDNDWNGQADQISDAFKAAIKDTVEGDSFDINLFKALVSDYENINAPLVSLMYEMKNEITTYQTKYAELKKQVLFIFYFLFFFKEKYNL